MRISDWSSDVCSSDLTLLFDGDDRAIGQTLVDARAVFYIARQLPASCGDIVAARFTYCSDHTRIHQTLGKQADARGRRPFQTRLRERIEGDQIELAAHLICNSNQFAGMLVGIIDAIEHDVFESDEIADRKSVV